MYICIYGNHESAQCIIRSLLYNSTNIGLFSELELAV